MSPEKAKIVTEFLAKNLERESALTRKVLAAVPADKMDWQPHEKGFTAGALAWHIASIDCYFVQGIVDGGWGPPAKMEQPKTPSEIVAFYEQHLPGLIAKAQDLTGEQAVKEITFMGKYTQPAVMFLNLATGHSIHHRGQLSAYLRAMGARVPSIYGQSADDK